MKKNILIILSLLFLTACSQKQPKVKVQPIAVQVPSKKEPIVEQPKEFIPEHIRRSRIEVVKHY